MEQKTNTLSPCNICPRKCGVDRMEEETGFCRASKLPKVALVSAHRWEEPPISGDNGSGTVFFSNCNMHCVFCQNYKISVQGLGEEISLERLSEIFIEQQKRGLHNINLVSPTQYIPQIAEALIIAKKKGLYLPVVYNSNGYESPDGLKLLSGLVDVYLPDFKYWDNALALKYSSAPFYRETAIESITEMKRQAPKDIFDSDGVMKKGLILRHLVLPSHYKDSFKILDWVKESLGLETIVSLMSQYIPVHEAVKYKEIARRLTTYEYNRVREHFFEIGLKNGYMQKRSSAKSDYTPVFDLMGVKKTD